MSRADDWKHVSNLAGRDEDGEILPPAAGTTIERSPNSWWRSHTELSPTAVRVAMQEIVEARRFLGLPIDENKIICELLGAHFTAREINANIDLLKSMVACPACCSASGTPRGDDCRYCNNRRVVTEQASADYEPA